MFHLSNLYFPRKYLRQMSVNQIARERIKIIHSAIKIQLCYFYFWHNLKYACTDMFWIVEVKYTLQKDMKGYIGIILEINVHKSRETALPWLNASGAQARLQFVFHFTWRGLNRRRGEQCVPNTIWITKWT
jgi:Holliday junction resolvase-like predicted endonuclease